VKRDSTAIVACSFASDVKKVRLVWHRIFQPSPKDPLDFEATIERSLMELRDRFYVREIRYDPWQLVSVSQRFTADEMKAARIAQGVDREMHLLLAAGQQRAVFSPVVLQLLARRGLEAHRRPRLAQRSLGPDVIAQDARLPAVPCCSISRTITAAFHTPAASSRSITGLYRSSLLLRAAGR
jgi:hypothetical protein